MDNNQFYPKSSSKKLFEWLGFGLSCGGCFLTVLFSIITCSRGGKIFRKEGELKLSLFIIGVIIGALIAVAGLVFSILSIERGTKLAQISKITMVSIIVAFVAIFWAIVPNATICGYNCVVNDLFD